MYACTYVWMCVVRGVGKAKLLVTHFSTLSWAIGVVQAVWGFWCAIREKWRNLFNPPVEHCTDTESSCHEFLEPFPWVIKWYKGC